MAQLINITNSTVKNTVWTLLQDSFGPDDAKWIVGIGATVNIDQPTHTFDSFAGKTFTVKAKPRIEIITTTDKQHNLLMLKYSDRIIKLSEVIVEPHSVMEFRTTW